MKIYYGHEILNDFTKEEIIEFLRRNFISKLFRRSELLFVRWDLQSKKLIEEEKILSEKRMEIDKNTPEGYKKWLEIMEFETKLFEKMENTGKILEESHEARKKEEKL